MKYLVAIIAILIIISFVKCPTFFCFPVCGACNSQDYDGCTGTSCRSSSQTAFSKPGSANSWSSYSCTKTNYSGGYYSTSAKWEPCARTTDIPSTYNMGNTVNVTVEQLTTSIAATSVCSSWSNGIYNYWGDLAATDIFTITHPGISNPVYFWQVRIIYGVITFDQWSTSEQIITKFISNTTAPSFSDNVNSSGQRDMCHSNSGPSDNQRYNKINHDFTYSDPSGMQWNISTTNSVATYQWGVLNVIVLIRLCHPYCTECYGDGYINVCTACDFYGEAAKLSVNTCNRACAAGYGDNAFDPAVCIQCDINCKYCQDYSTNCLDCFSPFLLLPSATPNTVTCTSPCPSHYYANITANDTCIICDPNCLDCSGTPTHCISCYATYYLYQNVCHNPCPYQTYPDDPTLKCYLCNNYCSVCAISANNCSVCDTSGPYISYLKDGTTCLVQCGYGYFQDNGGGLGPNLCITCDTKCSTCDINSTNCFSCASSFYLLGTACDSTCPFPQYFTDDATWKCLDCATHCVNMTMTLRWKDALKEDLICDLQFTQGLSWGPTQIANFLTVTTDDATIDLNTFNFVYEAITPRIMRLTLSPKSYTFIYNVTFNFKTNTLNPANYNYAANGYRFSDANYEVESEMLWFLIKAPSLSNSQKTIMDSVAKFSDKIEAVTTMPYIQEIKKAGLFAMILGGAQITSTAVLVNTIPSQNFYQGVRFWASFVFFDVPPWEQNSNRTKYVVVPQVDNLIKNARLIEEQAQLSQIRSLFDTSTIGWRFQRTGYTSFFIFDTYINIFLIVCCWILLLIANCCIKHKINQKKVLGMFYSFTIKVHEITIFYISLTTLLEWIYFDAASLERWISLGMCIFFNVYFLFYQLYIYHDMINYPAAQIGNSKYDYYCVRYGSLLKNIRFQQYDPHEQWSIKHWFRPYNYHIMSYYKKFLMMIALPIFYSTKNAQIGALIVIQLLQMVRFIVIWPFYSKARNFIRLGLQICLLIFFLSIVAQTMELQDIMAGDPSIIQKAVNYFYNSGWIGFAMVFVFNVGHIIIWIFDLLKGCKTSNRQMMDEARKLYYMTRLKTYEQQNEDVPLALVNKWVKLGNLNDRKYDDLPDLNLRIEYFRILKTSNGYQIDMRKLFQVFLNIQFNYQKQNNVSAGKKLNKRFTLTRSLSPQFYAMIQNLYNEHIAVMDFEYMTIKTFHKVAQSQYKPGQKIQLTVQKMQQKIQLQTYAGQKKVIKLDKLLPGFPISYEDLKQFA